MNPIAKRRAKARPSAQPAASVPLDVASVEPLTLLRQLHAWWTNSGHTEHPDFLAVARCLAANEAASKAAPPPDLVDLALVVRTLGRHMVPIDADGGTEVVAKLQTAAWHLGDCVEMNDAKPRDVPAALVALRQAQQMLAEPLAMKSDKAPALKVIAVQDQQAQVKDAVALCIHLLQGGHQSGEAQRETAATADPAEPLFQPFSWVSAQALAAAPLTGRASWSALRLVCRVRDVSNGLQTLLQMLERDTLGLAEPLLSEYHRGNLLRLAVASVDSLSDDAARFIADAERTAERSQARGAAA